MLVGYNPYRATQIKAQRGTQRASFKASSEEFKLSDNAQKFYKQGLKYSEKSNRGHHLTTILVNSILGDKKYKNNKFGAVSVLGEITNCASKPNNPLHWMYPVLKAQHEAHKAGLSFAEASKLLDNNFTQFTRKFRK